MKKKTHFGTKKALMGKTPAWAHNAIAVLVIITGIVQFIITQDNAIEPTIAYRICLYVNGIEMLALAILRLFGISNDLKGNKDADGADNRPSDIS